MPSPEKFSSEPADEPEKRSSRSRRGVLIGAVALTGVAALAAGGMYLFSSASQDPTIDCKQTDGIGQVVRIDTDRAQISNIDVVGYDGDTHKLPVIVTADHNFSINGHTFSYGEVEQQGPILDVTSVGQPDSDPVALHMWLSAGNPSFPVDGSSDGHNISLNPACAANEIA